ncbi:hypothetical protein AVEN_204180-1 [Araneus ventricosus]|uniref:Uncharacterized protein n=1 Tax=Araneus ventricosus TaxID=182803 RepID=A0A4Y2QKV8_ARAVE|nr:hypothetical protein AVEN_143075-1 [Araneus ventricosus]GBN63938.1 hypothetical protein AVEN_144966-1 [Araneus ventricosus]GBN63945.1 hypothetical protein AVEN_162780-1 [Araneus ventricosus]GBN63973.1 hypothetical protein AVEN_204180-1 [Araneus ventricosus]
MQAVIVVFEGEREFPLSSLEELGRSRTLRQGQRNTLALTLRSLYFNDIRTQRVKGRSVVVNGSQFRDWSVPDWKHDSIKDHLCFWALYAPNLTSSVKRSLTSVV